MLLMVDGVTVKATAARETVPVKRVAQSKTKQDPRRMVKQEQVFITCFPEEIVKQPGRRLMTGRNFVPGSSVSEGETGHKFILQLDFNWGANPGLVRQSPAGTSLRIARRFNAGNALP